MKRAFLGVVVCGALGLGMSQLAAADSTSITDSGSDATPNSVDIISAKAGHQGERKLRHVVKVDGVLNDSNPDLQILLQLSTDKDSECEFEFIWPPSGSSDLVKCGVGPKDKTGTISQLGPDTLEFVFNERVIGSPDKYGWRVITRDCVSCLLDTAPDQDGANAVYVRHRLG